MVVPNLLNPILVEISQIDEDDTVFKPRRREPANRVSRPTAFKVQAQCYFGKQEYLDSASGSDSRNLEGHIKIASGYIIVRKSDLVTVSKELSVGDKLISYGNVGQETSCEYYLIGKKDAAHYSDQGKPTLEKWFFEDRN